MEKMLVIVFDDEKKAYEGSQALNQLDSEGSITVHAESVVQKNADGTLAAKAEGDFPVRTVGGTTIGALIGLLGGLPGVAIGAIAGTLVGGATDIHAAGVDDDFLEDVSKQLTAGKYAVVADVSEEWETPLDMKIEALGGVVNRTTKKNFEAELRAKDVASLRTEIDGLKAEQAKASADRKARLQAKIDSLNVKLESKQAAAKQRGQQLKSESDAKIQALQEKETKARSETKSAIQARKAEIRKNYEDAANHLRAIEAEHWEKKAEGLKAEAAMFEERAKNIQAKAEQ
jgi:uncharacterized membrane protein